jgi:hypothetical protein
MHETKAPKSSRPVTFGALLCALMLGGEVVSGGGGNPIAVAFYCFLPVVFWMIADKQKRDALAIAELEDRIDRLEAGRPVYEAGILV